MCAGGFQNIPTPWGLARGIPCLVLAGGWGEKESSLGQEGGLWLLGR